VILVDANVLIYAQAAQLPQHEPARAWLEDGLNGTERLGLPWPSLLGFLRIVTNRRLFDPPVTIEAAWATVREWLGREQVWIPSPTARHAEALGTVLASGGVSGNLVPDAHLAALALEHGLTLVSCDRDFARFPAIRWIDPLS